MVFSPEDYKQSDAVRIMYVHVPAAWISLGIFSSITFFSLIIPVPHWIRVASHLIHGLAGVQAAFDVRILGIRRHATVQLRVQRRTPTMHAD